MCASYRRHSGARHLARTSDVQLHIGESRDDGCEIPGSCCAGPGMTETIVRVSTLVVFVEMVDRTVAVSDAETVGGGDRLADPDLGMANR
jgi:hypothetical protein